MKKQKGKQPQQLSPKKYIQTKLRNLPIKECWVDRSWGVEGLAQIFIVREHASGNVTVGMFLVDLYCLGVRDTYYLFNLTPEEYKELMDEQNEKFKFEPIAYNDVHNMILGAIEFAEEAGLKPHAEFATTQFFLQEDSDEIPLITYEFGLDGKHHLIAFNEQEADKYYPILENNLGDAFSYEVIGDEEEELEQEEDAEAEEEYASYEDVVEEGDEKK